MLLSEKSRLVTAIQACEAATASVSRPGSPMTDQETTYSEKELNVKAKLEDLIDQVDLTTFCKLKISSYNFLLYLEHKSKFILLVIFNRNKLF